MSLSCYWQWISSSHCQSSLRIHSAIASWIHSYFDNVMTKFMINNRTDAWKTDINLLKRKQNWTAISTNLKETAGKVKSVFVIRVALWAEELGRCLEYCRSWKNTLGKLVAVVNTRGRSIRGLKERSIGGGGNLCPLWLVILKSVWYSVGDFL